MRNFRRLCSCSRSTLPRPIVVRPYPASTPPPLLLAPEPAASSIARRTARTSTTSSASTNLILGGEEGLQKSPFSLFHPLSKSFSYHVRTRRFFSSDDKDKDKHNNNKTKDTTDSSNSGMSKTISSAEEDSEELFGIPFSDKQTALNKDNQEEEDLLFAAAASSYERDETTGKLLSSQEGEEEEAERLTPQQEKLLKAEIAELDEYLDDRLSSSSFALDEIGQRIREHQMGLNVLGRKVHRQNTNQERFPDGTPIPSKDPNSHFTEALRKDEFLDLKNYLDEQYDVEITPDDIPTQGGKASPRDPHEQELINKWLHSKTKSQHSQEESTLFETETVDDDASTTTNSFYTNLLPSQLRPATLVSRKRAKALPREMLHHNHIPLLHSYLTSTGQIQHRIQTRLGARDQRKIAKLIKRARALGLLPHSGQSKVEEHGWIHEPDLQDTKPWERELERRGLWPLKRTNDAAEQQTKNTDE